MESLWRWVKTLRLQRRIRRPVLPAAGQYNRAVMPQQA
jgi:hypothetical protein